MNSKIFISIGIVIILAILSVVGVAVILNGIRPIREQISQTTEETNVLKQRQETLQNVQNLVNTQSGTSLDAMPNNNSTAVVLTQLKQSATDSGIILSTVSASGGIGGEGGVNNIRFDIRGIGEYTQIINFFLTIKNFLPLINIEEFKIEESGAGSFDLTTVLSTNWSPLPESLPEITSKLDSLTEDEINLLSQLSKFTTPNFETLSPQVATDSGRLDPFNLQQEVTAP